MWLACKGLKMPLDVLQAPDFYAPVPPAPPGLEWWRYRADVPPLPQPEQYFHSKKYRNWGKHLMLTRSAVFSWWANLGSPLGRLLSHISGALQWSFHAYNSAALPAF